MYSDTGAPHRPLEKESQPVCNQTRHSSKRQINKKQFKTVNGNLHNTISLFRDNWGKVCFGKTIVYMSHSFVSGPQYCDALRPISPGLSLLSSFHGDHATERTVLLTSPLNAVENSVWQKMKVRWVVYHSLNIILLFFQHKWTAPWYVFWDNKIKNKKICQINESLQKSRPHLCESSLFLHHYLLVA